jgi:hypothetical protein
MIIRIFIEHFTRSEFRILGFTLFIIEIIKGGFGLRVHTGFRVWGTVKSTGIPI